MVGSVSLGGGEAGKDEQVCTVFDTGTCTQCGAITGTIRVNRSPAPHARRLQLFMPPQHSELANRINRAERIRMKTSTTSFRCTDGAFPRRCSRRPQGCLAGSPATTLGLATSTGQCNAEQQVRKTVVRILRMWFGLPWSCHRGRFDSRRPGGQPSEPHSAISWTRHLAQNLWRRS